MNERERELECVISDLTLQAKELRAELAAAQSKLKGVNRAAEYSEGINKELLAELERVRANNSSLATEVLRLGGCVDGC